METGNLFFFLIDRSVEWKPLGSKMRAKTNYAVQQVEFSDDVGWFSEQWAHSSYLKQSPESFTATG